ncbi:hypothetical protein HpMS107_06670 [Helicobacter pylori]
MDPAEGGKFLWRLQRPIGVEHRHGAAPGSHRRECGAKPTSIRCPRFRCITVFLPYANRWIGIPAKCPGMSE